MTYKVPLPEKGVFESEDNNFRGKGEVIVKHPLNSRFITATAFFDGVDISDRVKTRSINKNTVAIMGLANHSYDVFLKSAA